MKKTLFSLFIAVVSLTAAYAQTAVNATIDDHFQIVLPADKSLTDTYTIDISNISFKSQEDCVLFFDRMHEIVVNYEVDYAAKLVTVKLTYDKRNEGWQLPEWNKYFAARAKKMSAVYTAMNQ